MTYRKLVKIHWLSQDAEQALLLRHETEIAELLPILGPLFGIAVLTFGLWDHFIDPRHALTTFAMRLFFVAFGSLAYFSNRLRWSIEQRCCHIYWTHAGVIVLCEFMLKQGFVYGLAGITCCLFVVAVISINLRSFFLMISLPTALLLVLGALGSSAFEYINEIILYVFSGIFSCILMMVIRYFRRSAFFLETALLNSSRRDAPTGAYNRSYLEDLAQREIALSRRQGTPLAAAMLDIDHFKRINDNHGHAIGDLAIKSLVSVCLENLREIDHFGRIGGEEFACILPATTKTGAIECAERLRQAIEALRIDTSSGPVQFTVSIGVVQLQARHAGWSDLLKDADEAMYRAKNEGRNRICMSDEGGLKEAVLA